MYTNLNGYDAYEQARAAAEAAWRHAEGEALSYQTNTTVSAAQRQEKALAAQQARDSYNQMLAANQSQHERNLQRASMEHKFGDQQLQRDLADKETEREKERWGAIGRMFGGMGMGMQGFGGAPGISLHDNGGQRIGGTAMQSPLAGLTRK